MIWKICKRWRNKKKRKKCISLNKNIYLLESGNTIVYSTNWNKIEFPFLYYFPENKVIYVTSLTNYCTEVLHSTFILCYVLFRL